MQKTYTKAMSLLLTVLMAFLTMLSSVSYEVSATETAEKEYPIALCTDTMIGMNVVSDLTAEEAIAIGQKRLDDLNDLDSLIYSVSDYKYSYVVYNDGSWYKSSNEYTIQKILDQMVFADFYVLGSVIEPTDVKVNLCASDTVDIDVEENITFYAAVKLANCYVTNPQNDDLLVYRYFNRNYLIIRYSSSDGDWVTVSGFVEFSYLKSKMKTNNVYVVGSATNIIGDYNWGEYEFSTDSLTLDNVNCNIAAAIASKELPDADVGTYVAYRHEDNSDYIIYAVYKKDNGTWGDLETSIYALFDLEMEGHDVYIIGTSTKATIPEKYEVIEITSELTTLSVGDICSQAEAYLIVQEELPNLAVGDIVVFELAKDSFCLLMVEAPGVMVGYDEIDVDLINGYLGSCDAKGYLISVTNVPEVTPPEVTTEPSSTPSSTPASTQAPTPTVAPTSAPAKSVGDFVNRCYDVALGRPADSAGYQYWVDSLTGGAACGAQVGYGFIFSTEYFNKNTTNEEFVTDLYNMYFGRKPDDAGFKYWVDMLNNDISREIIFAGFANSEEFYNLCTEYQVVQGIYLVGIPNDQQGGVNCFVARMYKVCLNRLPDMGGQSGWVQKLMDGEVTGTTCSYGFVFSPEFMGLGLSNEEFVNYMYAAFFGREADEAGFNAWVARLDAGDSYEEVFAGFSGSAEFFNLCASYGINA